MDSQLAEKAKSCLTSNADRHFPPFLFGLHEQTNPVNSHFSSDCHSRISHFYHFGFALFYSNGEKGGLTPWRENVTESVNQAPVSRCARAQGKPGTRQKTRINDVMTALFVTSRKLRNLIRQEVMTSCWGG